MSAIDDFELQWSKQFEQYVDGMTLAQAGKALEQVVQGEFSLPFALGLDSQSVDISTDALFNLAVSIAARTAKSQFAMKPGLVPIMVALIAASRSREEKEKVRQAYALHALFKSGIWQPFADEVDGNPSWKSFVGKYLPGCSYTSTVNRVRTVEVFGVQAGWGMDMFERIGMSKMTAARKTVELELANGGIEPATQRVLEEETYEGVLSYIADQRKQGNEHIVSVFVSEAGVIRLELDDIYYDLGSLKLTAPDGVTQVEWDSIISLALRGLRSALADVSSIGTVSVGIMAEQRMVNLV